MLVWPKRLEPNAQMGFLPLLVLLHYRAKGYEGGVFASEQSRVVGRLLDRFAYASR
jgi:hypothetical protein